MRTREDSALNSLVMELMTRMWCASSTVAILLNFTTKRTASCGLGPFLSPSPGAGAGCSSSPGSGAGCSSSPGAGAGCSSSPGAGAGCSSSPGAGCSPSEGAGAGGWESDSCAKASGRLWVVAPKVNARAATLAAATLPFGSGLSIFFLNASHRTISGIGVIPL